MGYCAKVRAADRDYLHLDEIDFKRDVTSFAYILMYSAYTAQYEYLAAFDASRRHASYNDFDDRQI